MKQLPPSSLTTPPQHSSNSSPSQTKLPWRVWCVEGCGEGEQQKEQKLYECWVEVVGDKMIGYGGEREKVEWEFELDSNVLLSVERGNKVNVPNQKQINKIKFIMKGKIHSIALYHPQFDLFPHIYPLLALKPIFFHDFKVHYKPIKILPKKQHSVSYIAKNTFNDTQFFVKAYSLSLLSKKPELHKKVIKVFETLKSVNFPSIVRIQSAYRSQKTIYLVHQKMHSNIKVFFSNYFPNLTGKKIILKTILSTLHYLHNVCVYHRNITIKSLFVEVSADASKYRVKLGCFDECSKEKQSKTLQKQDIEAVGYLFQLLLNEKFIFDDLNEQLEIQGEDENERQKGFDLLKKLMGGEISARQGLQHQYLREVQGEWIQKI